MLHVPGLLLNPSAEWEKIRDQDSSPVKVFATHTWLFALIGPICGYYGTTETGWSFGAGDPVRLATGSAARIAILYYFATLVTTGSVAAMVRWMSTTYGSQVSYGNAFALASYSATPLFMIGALELYPVLWINLLAGLPALAFTTFLFYTGVPIVARIPPERGFLLSSAMMAFGLVSLVALLAIIALLWGFGLAPEFVA